MMKKGSLTTAKLSVSKACLFGVGIFTVVIVLQAMVWALLISYEYLDIKTSIYLAGAAQFSAVFAGCIIAGKSTKERRMVVCLIVAAACVLMQLGAAILFFDGISENFALGLLANFAGCSGAAILSIVKNERPVSKKRKARSR